MKVTDERDSLRRTYPNWLDLLAVLGIFIAASIVVGPLSLGAARLFELPAEVINTLAYALQFILTIAFVVLMQRQRGVRQNFVRFNFRRFDPVMILLGVVMVIVSGVVIEPVILLFPSDYLEYVNQAIGTGGWAIFLTVVLAPILEEVLFRGLVLEPVRQKSGAVRGVLVSALLFGVIHIIPQQVINAFVIGIILGYIYVKTGSLFNVVIIHAINNGLAYVQMELLGERAVTATTRDLIGNDTLYWIVYAACVALLGMAIYGMMRSLKRSPAAVEESTPEIDNNSK